MPTLAEILAGLSREVEKGPREELQEPKTGFKLSETVADPMCAPFGWQTQAPDNLDLFRRGDPVGDSTDLQRILALPKREPLDLKSVTAQAMIELEMQKYAIDNPNCRCKEIDPRKACIKRLLPAQAWMLREVSINQGLLAHASVGIGKCSKSDTEIFDYRTGRRRRVDEPGELDVATFDKTLFAAPATAFASGRKPCVQVKLRDGSSLEVSTDHPILTARGWIHATDLQPTDYVAVAVEMPDPTATTTASDDEVKFVAYMLSDGGCSQRMLSFTNMTPEIIDDWRASAENLGYRITEKVSTSKARQFDLLTGVAELKGRWTCDPGAQACRRCNTTDRPHAGRGLCRRCYQRVDVSSYPELLYPPDAVRARWELHGLARDKRAHADLWGLPRRQITLFVNRFWACDGHVSDRDLEITLASEKLIDDLRFMLTRLGIRSNKHYKVASYVKDGVRHKFDAWRLTISGGDALKFLTEVGDVLGKETACQALRSKLESTPRNPNNDVVPVGPKEFEEICVELGWRRKPKKGEGTPRTDARKFLWITQGQYVSRAKFRKFCEQWNYTGKYAHLATSDVAWERVISVTDIGTHDVYDLNVPGTHNFVANGVVIHNTLLNILAPLALTNVQSVLLLIPASLRGQIQHDYQRIKQHFKVPNFILHAGNEAPIYRPPDKPIPGVPTLHVLPYSRLSMPEESDFLQRLSPDAIISDECDAIRSMSSSRGIRIAKWFAGGDTDEERRKRMATKFLGWTGSLTDSSITEFNFLALFALRDRSPLPLDPNTVIEWGRCLDATTNPSPPGELLQFCEPGEDVRHAFQRRLAWTPGFIIANQTEIEVEGGEGFVTSKITEKEAPELPDIIKTALAMVRMGVRPDSLIQEVLPDEEAHEDEELEDALAIAQAAAQVSCGVLYYWRFPRGEPVALIKDWMSARRAFNREIREKALEGQTFLDSAKLCLDAAKRFWGDEPKREDRPEWRCESWPRWQEIQDKVEPQEASCVLHDFLCVDAVEWALESPGIVWFRMRALAAKMRQLSGLPVHDGGPKGEAKLMAEKGDKSIICSIDSNGRGRDGLQHVFHRQLIVNPMASATRWEQLLGRAHRRGQKQNVVTTEIYLHTPEMKKSLKQAKRRSDYVAAILNANPILLGGYANIADLDLPDEKDD